MSIVRHAGKIAVCFLLLGLVLMGMREQGYVGDDLAIPGVLVAALGFPTFILVGAFTRRSR